MSLTLQVSVRLLHELDEFAGVDVRIAAFVNVLENFGRKAFVDVLGRLLNTQKVRV